MSFRFISVLLTIFLSCLNLTLKVCQCSSAQFHPPVLNLKGEFDHTPENSSDVWKMIQNEQLIGYLLQSGKIVIWHKENLTLYRSFDMVLTNSSKKYRSCSLLQLQELIAVASDDMIFQIYLNNLTVKESIAANLSGFIKHIDITEDSIFIFDSDEDIYRYSRTDNYSRMFQNQHDPFSSFYDSFICRKTAPTPEQTEQYSLGQSESSSLHDAGYDFFAYSSYYDNMELLKCPLNSTSDNSCEILLFSWDEQHGFRKPVQKVIYEFDQDDYIQIYDLREVNSVLDVRGHNWTDSFIQPDRPIEHIWWVDYAESLLMALYDNNSISLYNTSSVTPAEFFIKNYQLSSVVSILKVEWDLQREELFVFTQDHILVYGIECQGVDVQAKDVGVCVYEEPVVVQEDDVQQNVDPETAEHDDQNDFQGNIHSIGNLIRQSFESVADLAKYSTLAVSVLPVTGLFIRFISFWNICSFFVFLDFPMPTYLEKILLDIYGIVNTSIFKELGYTGLFPTDMGIGEKLPAEYFEQYSISTNIFAMNIENLAELIISLTVLALIYKLQLSISRCLDNQNQDLPLKQTNEQISSTDADHRMKQIPSSLNIFRWLFIAQLISFGSNLTLSFFVVLQQTSFGNIFEKFNFLTIYCLLGFCISASLALVFYDLLSQKPSATHKDDKRRKKVSRQENLPSVDEQQIIKQTSKQKDENKKLPSKSAKVNPYFNYFFLLSANVWLPFGIVSGMKCLPVIINSLVISSGVYLKFKEYKNATSKTSSLRHFNQMALYSEFLVVHLCMVCLEALNWLLEQDFPDLLEILEVLAVLSALLIVFITAHQTMTFFIDVLAYINSLFKVVIEKCCISEQKGDQAKKGNQDQGNNIKRKVLNFVTPNTVIGICKVVPGCKEDKEQKASNGIKTKFKNKFKIKASKGLKTGNVLKQNNKSVNQYQQEDVKIEQINC